MQKIDENEMYHADTSRIGKSGLDLINKAPAYYYAKYLDPNREREGKTEALIMGSALHTIILEPYKFKDEYVVSPKFEGEGMKARKKAFMEMNAGKQPLSVDTYDTVCRVRDAVMKHPLIDELLGEGVAEQRIDWIDPITGAPCKAKPDFRNTKNRLIVDLKSTEDASQDGFERSSFKYRYHVQAPFYFDGAMQNGFQPTGFVFIAFEKEPPYLVNIFFADEEMMRYGRSIYIQNLETYMECLRSGEWKGYDSKIKPLSLPQWVLNKM